MWNGSKAQTRPNYRAKRLDFRKKALYIRPMTLRQQAAAQNNRVPTAEREPYTATAKERNHLGFVLARVRKSIATQEQAQLLAARKARLAATRAQAL